MNSDMQPMRKRSTLLNEALLKCPCCRDAGAFKIRYAYKPQTGLKVLSIERACSCNIDEETLNFIVHRAVREHHDGQLI